MDLPFDDVKKIVAAAAGPKKVDFNRLQTEIFDLLRAVGCYQPDEFAKLFHAFSEQPSDRDRAREVKRLESSRDPLAQCSSTSFASLNARVRARWRMRDARPHTNRTSLLPRPKWEELNDWERETIRHSIRGLAEYFRAIVRLGPPNKVDHDALMLGLGDIFASAIGFEFHTEELPHAQRSHFIRFCRTVLAPFFPPTLVSAEALSKRWLRLKNDENAELEPENVTARAKFGPKRPLKSKR